MATGSVPASTARQDHERFIERQLDRTRRQVKVVELAAAGVTLLVGVLAFFFVAALIDHWVLGLSTFARFALLAMLIGGIGWYAWTVLWPLIRNSINPAYAALTIESSTPTLKNSLINFLMLRSHRGEVHDVVYEAVGQRAATDLQHVPMDSVVDYSKLIKVGYALAAVFAICAAYQILSPKDPLQTFARVAAPWADIARPSRVQIDSIEPGDAQQYFGDQVTISAVIRGARSSDRMVLLYSTADGQIHDQAIELTPDDAHHRFSTKIPRDGQGLQQNITYRIEAGDAVTRDYTLTVVSAPTIVVEKLEYDFPAYTQRARETRERNGDIRALEGTRVTIHAQANTPIQAAHLEFDPVNDHAPEATLQRQRVTLQASGTTATGSFVLELQPDRVTPKFSTYQITFVTDSGQLGQHPALHTIDVIRDLPPEVEILAPRTQQVEVPENGEAVVEVRALDPDYALSHVGVKLASGGRDLASKTLLNGPSKAGQAVTKFHFRPSEFKLRAGDEVAYWATAADNRTSPQTSVPEPNTERTSNQFFKIVPADPHAKPAENPDQKGQPQDDRPPMGNDHQPQPQQPGEKGTADQPNQADQGRDPNQQPMNDKGADEGGSNGSPNDKQQPNEKNSNKSEPNDQPRDQGDMGKSPNDQSQGGGAGDDQKATDKPKPNEDQGKNESGMGGGTNAGENEGEGNAAEQPQTGGKQPKGGNQAGGSNDEQNKGSSQQQEQGGGGQEQGSTGQGQGARDQGDQNGTQRSEPNAKPENSQGGSSGDNESGERQPLHEGEAFEKALERMLEKARQEQGKTPQGESGRDTQQQPSQEDIDKLPQHLKDRLQELLKKQQQQQQQPQDGAGGQQQSQPGVKGDGNQPPQQNPPGPSGENQAGEGSSGEQTKPAGADKKQGTGANNQRSQGGSGKQEGGDNTRPEEASRTGEPESEGERQGGMGQSGDAGAGRANDGKTGSPQAKKASRDRPKSMQSNNEKPSEGDQPSNPSESKRQSDSEGGEGGEESGGGKQGGGQRANAAGNDSAGSNSAADEGAGAANQSGMGETSGAPGDKQKAPGQTGQAGNEAGNGSTTQKDPRGNRPGQTNQTDAGEQAPMQEKQPQPTGRDDREGTGQTGDFVTGGGKPSEQHGKSRFADAEGPAAEQARLDYAREATDLVLEYLKDQKDRPDQELLNDLGWTQEDLKQFLAKWEAAKREAAVKPDGKRELDEALRSLGLRPGQDKLRRGETRSDNVRGLGDVGPTSGPPSKYLEQFRAFKKGAARGK